jgi:hypothetical protein
MLSLNTGPRQSAAVIQKYFDCFFRAGTGKIVVRFILKVFSPSVGAAKYKAIGAVHEFSIIR